jgi:uncharacterized surface protein with fasciclin (FAS1) repeats
MKMNKLKFLGLFAFIAILSTSCSDDDDNGNNNPSSISEIAAANANLSILVDALERTNLVSTLDASGSYTVFAPTNAAFTTFLEATPYSSVDEVPVDVLTQILLNHVIATEYDATSLPADGYIKTLGKGSASTTNTLSMYVKKTGGIVTLNGISDVASANIEADNGIIHVVDAVIGLPTVVDHAVANTSFSTLTGLLSSANLVTTLDGTAGSPFTVFAPNDAAFTTFENENPGTLGSLTPAQVSSVLLYHVVGGANVLSTGIPASATSLETGILQFSGTTITDEANRQTNIIATDVQASNGVIHVVNNVLLPQL